jgi:hypothetical protein
VRDLSFSDGSFVALRKSDDDDDDGDRGTRGIGTHLTGGDQSPRAGPDHHQVVNSRRDGIDVLPVSHLVEEVGVVRVEGPYREGRREVQVVGGGVRPWSPRGRRRRRRRRRPRGGCRHRGANAGTRRPSRIIATTMIGVAMMSVVDRRRCEARRHGQQRRKEQHVALMRAGSARSRHSLSLCLFPRVQ